LITIQTLSARDLRGRKTMRILIRLNLLICYLLISGGCEKALPLPLKIGTNKWIGYETLYLAQSLQLFDPRAIKLIEMPSSTMVARALRNGSLDVAALTLDETLTLMQYVPDLRIILVMDRSVGADALLAKPEIQSLTDLKKKRVGVENSAVGAILLDAALRAGKLQASDIELVSVNVNDHERYYQNDKVDALVTFEPYKSRLVAVGAQNLFDSSKIPGKILDVLVTRSSVIQQHEATLKTLIAAHFSAVRHFFSRDAEAMEIVAAYLGVRQDDVVMQVREISIPDLQENRRLLQGELPELKSTMEDLVAMMRQRQLLFLPLDTHNILNARLLPVHE
jgi:NitT/TauT family transport system substrate-binding protein